MRLPVTAILVAAVVLSAAFPAAAADMPRYQPAPAPAPVPALEADIIGTVRLCHVGAPVDVYRAPGSMTSGLLPAGMIVELMDPYDPRLDLWVRIKPPRPAQYYGWVSTLDLICI